MNCHNIPEYQQEKINENTEVITCTCTKSNCNKKYCECYKAGKQCNYNCRCLNCANKLHKDNDDNEEEINKKNVKKYKKNEKCDINNFVIEGIDIFIDKGILFINDKKTITIEHKNNEILNGNLMQEEKLLGSKRERNN